MAQHSIITFDGAHSYVPSDQVPAAIRAGGKPPYQCRRLMVVSGTFHSRSDRPIKAGGKLLNETSTGRFLQGAYDNSVVVS